MNTNSNSSNKKHLLVYLLLFLISFAFLSVLYWASDKGFDLSDEGVHLYLYSKYNTDFLFVSNFHFVQHYFFPFLDCSIKTLRVERIFLSLLSSIVFSFALYHFIKSNFLDLMKKKLFINLFLFVFSGTFLSYAFGPQTPSYNIFSSFIITIICSLFLFDSKSFKNIWYSIFNYLFVGFLTGALFFIKFPNAILVFITFPFFYYVFNIKKTKSILIPSFQLILILVGCFLFQVSFWGNLNGIITYINDFTSLVKEYKTHDNTVLVSVYFHSLADIVLLLFTKKYIIILCSIILLLWSAYKNKKALFCVFLFTHVFLLIYYNIYLGGEANKFEQTIIYLLWISCIVIYQLATKRNTFDFSKTVFYSFLFLLPILYSLGTLNAIQVQVVFYMASWLTLLYFLIQKIEYFIFKIALYSLFVCMAFVQSADAVLFHPYRINGNLFNQKEELFLNRNEKINVDAEFKKGINSISLLLEKSNIKKDDCLFLYSDVVGLSYIFDYQLPTMQNPWFDSNYENINLNTLKKFYSQNQSKNVYYLLDSEHLFSDSFKKGFKKMGIDFNVDFYAVGNAVAFFDNKMHIFTLFAPKKLYKNNELYK